MSEYRSICCHAPVLRLGRARFECEKCRKDVTIDLVFYEMAKENDNKRRKTNNPNRATTLRS